MSFLVISMTISILFSCFTGWSQQPNAHFTARDFSHISPQTIRQPLSFKIINSQEDTIYFSQINWPPIIVNLDANPEENVITDPVTVLVKTYEGGYETSLPVIGHWGWIC
jgi:hypothetical protein